jgi:hypothetical protein
LEKDSSWKMTWMNSLLLTYKTTQPKREMYPRVEEERGGMIGGERESERREKEGERGRERKQKEKQRK